MTPSRTYASYAPDGRLAVVRDGAIVVGGNVVAEGEEPDWSPDGRLASGDQSGWAPPRERTRSP